jgi:hypothetical protein
MKNIAILCFGVFACGIVNAQQTALKTEGRRMNKPSEFVKPHHIPTQNNKTQAVIWSEDFSGGVPSTWSNRCVTGAGVLLPNGSWEYRGPSTTPNATVGTRGAWSAPTPINSPTRSNGFVIFDSDFLDNNGSQSGAGNGPAPAPHIGILTTDTIDLTGNPFVELKFNGFARQWNTSEFKVAISNDGGVTYTDTIQFHQDLGTNATGSPSTVNTANISAVAGNQPYVMLAFIFDGAGGTTGFQGYYYWQVDDIEIRDLPRHALRFSEASDGAPVHDIIYDGGGARQPRMGHMSLPHVMPINFDSNLYNFGSQTQTNVKLTVEIYNGTSLVTSLNSGVVASLAAGDTATYVDLVTPQWTPSANGTYDIVYTYTSDSVTAAMAERDTFNVVVRSGDGMLGNNANDISSLDWGNVSNGFGTTVTDYGTDGGGQAVMLDMEGIDNYVEGVDIGLVNSTVDGGDVLIEVYDTAGFSFTGGFGGNALISEQFTVPTGSSGTITTFNFTTGSGPNGELYLDAGTYYFVVYTFSNGGANDIEIANDQSFAQVGRASMMYFVADSRWYSGYTGSLTFNAPFIRARSENKTASLGDADALSQLKVYPNPSRGEVNIEMEQAGTTTLELLDLAGNRLYTETISGNGNETITRDFSHMPKGMYILNASGETHTQSVKLSIQ